MVLSNYSTHEIFKFIYKDKYQFKLSEKIGFDDIKDLVSASFYRMNQEFDVRDQTEYSLGSIPQPNSHEFGTYNQHTFQFFAKETS